MQREYVFSGKQSIVRKKEETRKLFKEKLFLMKINIKKKKFRKRQMEERYREKERGKMDKQNRKL